MCSRNQIKNNRRCLEKIQKIENIVTIVSKIKKKVYFVGHNKPTRICNMFTKQFIFNAKIT